MRTPNPLIGVTLGCSVRLLPPSYECDLTGLSGGPALARYSLRGVAQR